MADDASITPTVSEHPSVQAARLRAKCEKAVDRLLAMLDALGPDPDDEPWLGFRESQLRQYCGLDQQGIAESGTDDREDVPDDDEPSLCGVTADGMSRLVDRNDCEAEHCGREPDVDDEYALGWAESESVAARPGPYPFSFPQDDREHDLGSPNTAHYSDQRHWGAPSESDRYGGENGCEDEGHDSDREPETGI